MEEDLFVHTRNSETMNGKINIFGFIKWFFKRKETANEVVKAGCGCHACNPFSVAASLLSRLGHFNSEAPMAD